MSRIKQLDSVRGIAILLVMLHHAPLGPVTDFLSSYPLGANIFFVLSGFLITGILLREGSTTADKMNFSRLTVFRNFFFRRALRIFPVYFLLLLILFLIDGSADKSKYLYFSTFTSNFYFYSLQAWEHPSALWSISVQEQFYIFWPWVILLCPPRYLIHAMLLFIAVGVGSHYVVGYSEFGSILTFDCFDSLGMGALLAWAFHTQSQKLPVFYASTRIMAVFAAILLISSIAFGIEVLPKRTLVSILALWLIAWVVYAHSKGEQRESSILDSRILIFMGRISFGLYLLHQTLPPFTTPLLDRLIHNNLPLSIQAYRIPFLILENLVLIFLFAWLSYKYIELPALKLKKYFVRKPVNQDEISMPVMVVPGTLATSRTGRGVEEVK